MARTWLVFKYEIQTNLARRSFVVTAFVLPVLIVLGFALVGLLKGGQGSVPAPAPAPAPAVRPSTPTTVEGYVDRSGLIRMLPHEATGRLVAYADEARARQALRAGEVTAYYVVPADYVQSGDLLYINPNLQIFDTVGQSDVMRWTLLVNSLNGDEQLAQQVRDPMRVTVTALRVAPERTTDEASTFWIPYATTLILYITIIMAGSLLRSSTGGERKSRLLEILLTSVHPSELLLGKLVALGLLGLLETAIWGGAGYIMLRLGGNLLGWPADMAPPPSILLWALVFFLGGYAVYGSLLAGLGALTGPNAPGSATADVVIVWPMIIPVFVQTVFVEQPHGPIATVLSLFPLTAPIAMLTRLTAGGVPAWQPFVAAAALLATAFFVVRAVGRAFRAQVLLSGQPFTLRLYLRTLLGRA